MGPAPKLSMPDVTGSRCVSGARPRGETCKVRDVVVHQREKRGTAAFVVQIGHVPMLRVCAPTTTSRTSSLVLVVRSSLLTSWSTSASAVVVGWRGRRRGGRRVVLDLSPLVNA